MPANPITDPQIVVQGLPPKNVPVVVTVCVGTPPWTRLRLVVVASHVA